MSAGEIARRKAYWFTDALKGGRVQRHIKDIDMLLKNKELTAEVNEIRLKALLQHACACTAYYKDYEGCNKLSDFPVIKKKVIKKDVDSFISKAYKKEKIAIMTTSGSYGVPMTFYMSPEKRARQLAEVIYFNRWVDYDVGVKHAYIYSQPSSGRKSELVQFMQNEVLMDCTVLSRGWLEKMRRQLKRKEIKFIIGFASVITELAEYINSTGDTPDMYNVKGVMVIAEPFLDPMRRKVVKAFNCPVIAKYSTQETGVIACECPEVHEYHLNTTGYIVELLELDSDKPVKTGQLGRVVITDLFSHSMPLIRYDIGDLALMGDGSKCNIDTPVLDRLEGRIAAAVYSTSGNMVHFASVDNRIWDMKNVLMYQFIQEGRSSYTIKLIPLDGYDESQEQLYSSRVKEVLGDDAEIRFEKVDDIPPLNSGKRPIFINNYRPEVKPRL